VIWAWHHAIEAGPKRKRKAPPRPKKIPDPFSSLPYLGFPG
jgi:hypothetical protein